MQILLFQKIIVQANKLSEKKKHKVTHMSAVKNVFCIILQKTINCNKYASHIHSGCLFSLVVASDALVFLPKLLSLINDIIITCCFVISFPVT